MPTRWRTATALVTYEGFSLTSWEPPSSSSCPASSGMSTTPGSSSFGCSFTASSSERLSFSQSNLSQFLLGKSIQPFLIARAPLLPHSSTFFTSRLSRGNGNCVTVRRCKIFPDSMSDHLTEPCLLPPGPSAMQLFVRSVLSFVTVASVLASM